MNEQTDNREKAMEKALDVMEGLPEMTGHGCEELLQDEEVLQSCRDLQDVAFLLRAARQEVPDTEAALIRFKQRHRQRRFRRLWMAGAAVAATLLICIGFYHGLHEQTEKATTPVQVFMADNSPQQVTLDEGNGQTIVLAEHPAETPVSRPLDQAPVLNYLPRQTRYTTLQTHTLAIPRGETFKITLADGTEVWLNANTHFVYPTAFVGQERRVSLEGEAYFKVAHDAERPFIVETPHVRTRVLGTEFNIRSYTPDDTRVVLINGKVEVCNTQDNTYTRLTPGEEACLLPDGSFRMTEIDLDSYIYWKDGFFYFDDTTLKDIMEHIGRWYNVNIEFRNPEAMHYKMHFVSDRTKPLEYTINLMNRMKKVTVTCRNNTVTID